MKWGSKYVLAALGLLNITLLLLWAQTRKVQYDTNKSHDLLTELNHHSFNKMIKSSKSTLCNYVTDSKDLDYQLYQRLEDFETVAQDSTSIEDILKMVKRDTQDLKILHPFELYNDDIESDSFWQYFQNSRHQTNKSYSRMMKLAVLSKLLEFYDRSYTSCSMEIHSLNGYSSLGKSAYKVGDTLRANFFVGFNVGYCLKDAIKSIKVGEELYHLSEADFPNPSVLYPLTDGIPKRKIPIEMRISRAKGDTLIKDFWP